MGAVAGLDLVSALAFAAAFAVALPARRAFAGAASHRLLLAALGVYLFAGVSNLLEHAGVTARLDQYEDYLELLFAPLLLMFLGIELREREIRRRARSEEELRRSEERYRSLVAAVDFGVALIGADFRILMTNRAQARMAGKSTEDLVGAECFRAFLGRDGVCERCPAVRSLADGQPHEEEFEGRRPDGEALWVRVRTFPMRLGGGAIAGFQQVVDDITARKVAAAERARLEERVLQNQKFESLGVLAGGIAHDFNNILAGIVGNAELALLELPPEGRVASRVDKVRGLAERAAELVNQLLAYAGRESFSVRRVHLNLVIEEMRRLLELSISKKAALRVVLAPDLPAVLADVTQVRQVIMNLVVNASESLGEGEGTIGLSTLLVDADRAYLEQTSLGAELPEGPYAALQVSDTGAGLTPEAMTRMFDPFYTTKLPGRGLGLSAVLGIVRGHRGAIRVASGPGRGTRVVVLLPAMPAGAAAAAPAAPAGTAGTAGTVLRGGGTVLVADDEEQVRSVAEQLLGFLGYRVLSAPDGGACVELFAARQGEIDLVLLDMTMPRLDGCEALRALRRLRPDVPVLVMTGFASEAAAARFGPDRPDGFLQKPFTVERLREAIGALGGP